ncbi:amidohydrolase family protein [Euzebya tangerina]|uniref:amidohydrolase family protein n=1 Tax=Euzebya tangerina TaxID=591198 RepID=UPI000E31DFDA|nr:amidohydrolase family protein [Euzebya tangerina]
MPRSLQPGLSRRRFLAGSGALAAGALAVGACSGGGEVVVPTEVASRDPMDLDLIGLPGLRQPGSDDRIAITVRGRRILQVGQDVVDGAQTLDTDGGVVVPGFTDSHVHLQFADPTDLLAGGVTTVRDLGGPPDAAQALRGQTDLRVLLAGRILTPMGGYPTTSWGADGTGRQISGPEDAVAAVDEQVMAGATVVKVALEPSGGLPVFGEATLRAIVDHGIDAGLRVTAHVGSAEMLELAIETGVRELAHLPLHDVTEAEMIRAAEAGMVLVPTLLIRGPDDGALAALRAFREAGGEVLYGTDLGNGGTTPGIEVAEVELLQAAGMSPAEVLRAATSDPALYLGLDNGRLEQNAVADLVVLGSDPFEDPRAYDDIRLVVANGVVIG